MSMQKIITQARQENGSPDDNNYAKIYIASLPDDRIADSARAKIREAIERAGIKALVVAAGSFGYYDLEPLMVIEKPGKPAIVYANVNDKKVQDIASGYLVSDDGLKPETVLCGFGNEKIDGIQPASELPFFALQKRVVLRNCGFVDPGKIEDYILRGGYKGLFRALEMGPRKVIEEIDRSGLRGRAGAGYLVADKLKTVASVESARKYVVVNAVDADPRSRTAQLLLSSDPHSVFEGVLIAAYAVGASQAVLCISSGKNAIAERLRAAVEQMKKYGLAGERILGADFSCTIEIREVTPSLVSGEETALLRSLAGRQAMPYLRPPFPAQEGHEGLPTVIHNIETLAGAAAVFQHGAAWFSAIGTEESKGTKIVTLSGAVVRQYTVEVPFGTTLDSVINGIGGGPPDGKHIKAVQIGGPAGSYVIADSLDTSLSFEAFNEAGMTIGSGTVEVIGKDVCAVEMMGSVTSYLREQSCGKCVFCREGSYQIAQIFEDISEQKGTQQDLILLQELGERMKTECICDFGRSVPVPVLSSIRLFRDDFDTHIKEKRCPAMINKTTGGRG